MAMGNVNIFLAALWLAPLLTLQAQTTSSPILPERFTQIRALSTALPIRTAAEDLRDFLKDAELTHNARSSLEPSQPHGSHDDSAVLRKEDELAKIINTPTKGP